MMFTFSLDSGGRNIFSLAATNIMSDRLAADGTPPSAFKVVQDKNKRELLYACFKFTFVLYIVKRVQVINVNPAK